VPSESSKDKPVARALLGRAIDYAGLFPPAALPLPAVVANYRSYQRSSHAWALGRLVIPAPMLAQLTPPEGQDRQQADRLPVTALIGSAVADEVGLIERSRTEGVAEVKAVEVRTPAPDSARQALGALPFRWTRYLEVPAGPAGDAVLDLLYGSGAHAKLRTGGTEPGAVPEADALSHSLTSFRERGLAFKATAGLHHPVRGRYPLGEAGGATDVMYGYLNLLLAAALAWDGRDQAVVREALLESDPAAFGLGGDAFTWQGESFDQPALRTLRAEYFHGFGSCSFLEPLEELPA
jgi:hypothetical protein